MKKVLILLLTTVLLFTVGCSSNNTGDNAGNNQVSEGTETATETVNPVEALGLDYKTGLNEKGFYSDIDVKDYVTLADYQNLTIPSEIHKVDETYVQGSIDSILAGYATEKQVMDREIVDGDTVNIDYVGSVDGVEFEGGSTGGAGTSVTIGVTSYIDDFLAQLIGHKPGESFDIEVTFPENYGVENLNGKDAVFAITVNYISEQEMPELTDEFVKANLSERYESQTVEELKTFIESKIRENAIKGYIQNYLDTSFEVSEVPEAVISFQERMMTNYYNTSAVSYNVSLEEYLKNAMGVENVEDALATVSEQITMMSRYSMVIQSIAEDAGLEVTDEHMKAYFLANTGSEDYTQFADMYGLAYIKNSLLQEVVVEHLVGQVVLEE